MAPQWKETVADPRVYLLHASAHLKTNQMDTKASSPGSEMAQKDWESKFGVVLLLSR